MGPGAQGRRQAAVIISAPKARYQNSVHQGIDSPQKVHETAAHSPEPDSAFCNASAGPGNVENFRVVAADGDGTE